MGDHYGFSLTTFSPSGKLMQIEYALNAVKNGQPSVGVKAKDGLVLATENKSSILELDQPKIEQISDHIGMVYSGMYPDYRVLYKKARKIAAQYDLMYGEEIPTTQLVTKLAAVMQEYTQSGYAETLELDDAIHTALLTLRESFEVAMTEDNVEIGICTKDGFQRLNKHQIKDHLGSL